MLAVPHLRQGRDWSCGPACVRMVLRYFGEDASEAELIDALQASPQSGTLPRNLIGPLGARGLRTSAGNGRRVTHLARAISAGQPTIVALQAWGPPRTDYATSWDHGHYAVVVGVAKGRVYLVDPSSKRPRISFTESEFLKRWRDLSPDASKRYLQWGLSVGPKR